MGRSKKQKLSSDEPHCAFLNDHRSSQPPNTYSDRTSANISDNCHTLTGVSSDCYKNLVDGAIPSPHFYQSSLWNTLPPSSWLISDYSFVCSDTASDSSSSLLESQPFNTSSDVNVHSLEDKLVQIHTELNQIKTQLGPASIQFNHSLNTSKQRKKRKSPQDVFVQARALCNPFERIGQQLLYNAKYYGKKRFACRSALKLANIDALLDFQLIPEDKGTGKNPFVFVDLCGAPGGFSEYILYRIASRHKTLDSTMGFGMSLNGSNDDGMGFTWDMDHINSIHEGARNCFHVVNGSDGTGDIYNWNNVLYLKQVILNTLTASSAKKQGDIEATHSDGLVDLVVADGGFEAQRDSECQEDVTCRLILSQVSAALLLLKPGGNLSIKMFGFQRSMSQAILQMLYQSFEIITILKPIASRPASAERYVVCLRRRPMMALSMEKLRNIVESQDALSMTCIPRVDLTCFLLSFEANLLLLNTKACNHILQYMTDNGSSSSGSLVVTLWDRSRSSKNKDESKRYIKSWLL